ncbi:type VI secretion system baseplate subunit TssE [Oceanimonas sp. CHS3-5]|uniref:type VI secretion system baseplate subunit TssE n=1 Tax=Oceanimonas sp. CHS3-5 TaxID=3068186 RepID=UPI0027402257|nr:type VI secretion system baseplate subunit TssE [Oceanimonas sp. CHS3-5]MDP5291711.1 type VI secretion system baseplate subunit TssE [Oceanimonas sp. CHS3-5]
MRSGSLFERLTGEHAGRENLPAEDALAASISNHLAKLLGTRAGSVMTLPDYGLPDLNQVHLSLHDAMITVRNHIETVIRRYEPRLHQPRVVPESNPASPLKMRFHISGDVEVDGSRFPIAFDADLSGGGKIKVY